MTLKEKLNLKRFVVLVELQPPKGNDLAEVSQHAELLKERVDAISVPDLPNAIMRLGSLPVCAHLKSRGMEPIFNLSSGHRNRIVLQSELLNASALGLENLLLLQGDPPSIGDHHEAQSVADLDLQGLLDAANRLQGGYDLMGNELQGKPTFLVGTQVLGSAKGDRLDREISEMEKKVRVGVHFFVTNSIYDVPLFEDFIKKAAPFKVPIIASVTLLKSVGMARYMNQHIEGTFIPDSTIDRLMKASDKKQVSQEIAADLVRALRPLCQGIQLIPIGWEKQLPGLLDLAGM
jgi:methylenetetrahydrofolate reductase (NADPH)